MLRPTSLDSPPETVRPFGATPVLQGMSRLHPVDAARTMAPMPAPECPDPAAPPAYVQDALRTSLRSFVARRVHPDHVDDLVQDILLRMHQRAPELRDETRLAGWAFRIAQAIVADHHRARRPGVPLSETDEPAEVEDAGNLNEVVAGWLHPMLALLPDEYAEALELVDVQGLSQRAYAERAGLSISGAKSRVQRGRKMLEDVVRACCDVQLDARGNVIDYQRRNCRCGD